MSSDSVVDVDVVAERATVERVLPYLTNGWREYLTVAGGSRSLVPGQRSVYSLPVAPYAPTGAEPKHDALARVHAAMDARGVATAILEPGVAPQLSGLANVVLADELSRATNDWLAEEWLSLDNRFRGSIVVSGRDGKRAAAEVERLAADGRMAQVILAFPPCLLGHRSLYPLFEAAQDARLPVNLQAGGAYIGVNRGPTPNGFPTTVAEYEIDNAYGGIGHLVSVIVEKVLERFPHLRLVFSGFGVAWLPSVLWRLEGISINSNGLVHERIRFTTRLLETAAVANLRRILPEELERLLVYSSGYPNAEIEVDWNELSSTARERVMVANATEWFRLPGSPT